MTLGVTQRKRRKWRERKSRKGRRRSIKLVQKYTVIGVITEFVNNLVLLLPVV